MRDNVDIKMVRMELEETGFSCNVCRLGGISVILKFDSMEDRNSFLNGESGTKEKYFEEMQPWSDNSIHREYAIWVQLEEVPLHLWHENFFSSLGNRWGSFVRLDNCTRNKSRFDIARMLVMVDSRFKIPPLVTVRFKGQEFKILVSMDEFNDLEGVEMNANKEGSLKRLEMVLEAKKKDRNKHNSSDEKKVEAMTEKEKAGQTLYEGSIDLGARYDSGIDAVEFGSKLSEQEMIGVDKGCYDNRLICVAAASELMKEVAKDVVDINNNVSDIAAVLENEYQEGLEWSNEAVVEYNERDSINRQEESKLLMRKDEPMLDFGVGPIVPTSSIRSAAKTCCASTKRKKKIGPFIIKHQCSARL
ncbi:hypothetical protein DITRI_Ditri08aG0091900 [Diplodiscus trichospermus]